MSSYKVYLTKSSEVARRIASSFSGEFKTDDIQRISHGMANDDGRVPAIYHDKGYFFCVIELGENSKHDAPTYDLIIC